MYIHIKLVDVIESIYIYIYIYIQILTLQERVCLELGVCFSFLTFQLYCISFHLFCILYLEVDIFAFVQEPPP